jgi:hypothetical protein
MRLIFLDELLYGGPRIVSPLLTLGTAEEVSLIFIGCATGWTVVVILWSIIVYELASR